MQTRTLLLITAALAAVIVLTSVYLRDGEPVSGAGQLIDRDLAQSATAPGSDGTAAGSKGGIDRDNPPPGIDPAVYSEEERQRLLRGEILDRLQQAQDEPGNLQKFFNEVNRLCAQQTLDASQCQAALADALAAHPDQEFAAMVERILERMPAYEQQMQSTVMSTDMPPRERYEVIHEQRQQLLGAEETELMFGQERAMADFRFAYGELVSGAAQEMSAEERLEALNTLRQEAYGEYYGALSEEEGSHGAYRHDLQLLLSGVDDPARQASITRQLREQYFDSETIARMEQRDEQVSEQESRVSSYQESMAALEAEFESLRNNMTEEQWQAEYREAVRELRLEYFSE